MSRTDRDELVHLDVDELLSQYLAFHRTVVSILVKHDFIMVSGEDAKAYLQGQLAQDIDKLSAGSCCDSFLLEPDGHVTALVRVSSIDYPREAYLVEVEEGFGTVLLERLSRFTIRSRVVLEPVEWQCLALRGPSARDLSQELYVGDSVFAVVSWNGFEGIDVIAPSIEVDVNTVATRCSPLVFEMCRIEAGVPAMGKEIVPGVIPAETGLLERAVDPGKGCYTGQELVARMAARGNNAPRHLRGITWTSDKRLDPLEARGALLWDRTSGKKVGELTSSTYSFGLSRPLGLGYVHRTVNDDSELLLEFAYGHEQVRVAAGLVGLPIEAPAEQDQAQ